ncbi:membrane protein [Actibacterium mucosum KCTC 23349]|uniref:Peptidoglycan-associated lipoprotein n=1 Tax=Actibacterium mucosum KCTC 23349 TaxID=1454373 RepID=A0A037ZER1_9RHOB|nr:peptidoglycan-associated lipoprotein Pal [Actibacterium mucosum]KAJ54103.1 membrane protein [Actibacterium mucosum KCTC 23349]
MRIKSLLLSLATALVVAGCTSNNLFDGSGDAGANPVGDGGITDPTSVAYFQSSVGDRVLFEVDQSTLTSLAEQTLQGQVQWLLTNTDYTVIVEGHADEQGTREYNLALGGRRANAVQEYLVAGGVSPARVRTVTFGKERPIAICSDETCYAQNRRAVTVVTIGTGS